MAAVVGTPQLDRLSFDWRPTAHALHGRDVATLWQPLQCPEPPGAVRFCPLKRMAPREVNRMGPKGISLLRTLLRWWAPHR